VRIGVIGGGPGGLFFAYLMKKRDPAHDVTVVERNAEGNTYGFGVVFSDVALSFVRDVDAPLFDALTRDQVVHDSMRIVHRNVAVTLAGNVFYRMPRIALLQVLHRACADAGVRLEFNRAVADVADFAGCDLVVAADGANSGIRTAHRDRFQPTIDVRPNKLAWYATAQPIDPLSLVFRETEHGLMIAHAYRYSATRTTFLVECDPQTWRAAGLDVMPERDSVAYCERVFAPDLDGHPLLSNRSEWFNYAIVKNRHWHFDNVVLLGDALRTGHPSVGSGTRLAMQDAIALHEACRQCRGDVPAALAAFEQIRRPGSDALQAAAIRSTQWYETVRSKLHLDPVSFAYDYVRRTGKVSHAELARRDPGLAAAYGKLHPEGVPE